MDEQWHETNRPDEDPKRQMNPSITDGGPEWRTDRDREADPGTSGRPENDSDFQDAAMMKVMMEEASGSEGTEAAAAPMPPETPTQVRRAEFEAFDSEETAAKPQRNIDLLLDVSLPVAIELGRTQMSIKEILDLGSGSIVELDKLAGEPVDILINNRPLAKGEVVVLDEHFGVRITSLVSTRERLENIRPR